MIYPCSINTAEVCVKTSILCKSMEVIYFGEIGEIHFIRSSISWNRKPLSWWPVYFPYSIMQMWEFIRYFASFLLPSFQIYFRQIYITMHSLSKPAASVHKKNISLCYYYSHISHIVLVISCTKRIPIPVSLESESIRPQLTQSNIIPSSQWTLLHKQRVCSLFQTGEDFCFKKARLGAGKQCFVSSSAIVQEETKDWSENKVNNLI